MTVQEVSTIAVGIRRTSVTLLIVGLLSAVLPPAWRLPSSALADPGNGNGGEGNGNINSNDHDHENNGNGPGDNSGKGKDKDKDDDDDAAAHHAGAAAETERNGRDYVPDEVVVANLGDDVRSNMGRLGFVVLDEQQLVSLGLTITRLRVPRRMTAPAARTLLATQYPGVLVDLNANYRPQGARPFHCDDFAAAGPPSPDPASGPERP
jgi:hypothetical protein